MSAAVYLPGMMMDARLWDGVAEPGAVHGDLSRDDSIAGMAARCLSAAPERFALVGFSLGAIVAMELWRQAPARISRLVLIGLNPAADPPERRETRLALADRARAGGAETVVREIMLPKYFHEPSASLEDRVARMARDLGNGCFERQTTAQLARPDSWGTLGTISVPTLVACGAEDEMTDRNLHERIHQTIPGACLSVIMSAGHVVPMEQPAALRHQVQRFLQNEDA